VPFAVGSPSRRGGHDHFTPPKDWSCEQQGSGIKDASSVSVNRSWLLASGV
jgi:hypothetical protein